MKLSDLDSPKHFMLCLSMQAVTCHSYQTNFPWNVRPSSSMPQPLPPMVNTLRNTLSQAKSRFQLSKIFNPTSQTTRHPTPRQTIEEPDFYKPGGYLHVSLGDTFDSSAYTVLRKLGYGQYSTVWLAQNSK